MIEDNFIVEKPNAARTLQLLILMTNSRYTTQCLRIIYQNLQPFTGNGDVYSVLFVFLLRVFHPIRDFFLLKWRRRHKRWRAANLSCSALRAVEQWEILSVPHLLWHGASKVIYEDPWHKHLFLEVGSVGVMTCFKDFGL